jgi:hypothetical protein
MERFGARYLFVGALAESVYGGKVVEGRARALVASSRPRGAGTLAVEFRPPIVRTVLYRAARQLGSAVQSVEEGFVPPLAQLRLVAESAATEELAPGREIALFKLYERVAGARLRLFGATPGAPAVFEAEIETPRGRRFPYVALVTTDGTGSFELRFPYSTAVGPGSRVVRARWMVDGTERPVPDIPERAVVNGETVDRRW